MIFTAWLREVALSWLKSRHGDEDSTGPTTIDVVGSIDSGKGSCLVVRSGGMTVAIDCGGSPENGNEESKRAKEKIVAEILSARPKFLPITHFHFDHWGCLPEIVEAYRSRRLPLPSIVSTDTTWKLLERYLFEGSSMSNAMLLTLGFRGQSDRIRLIPSKHTVPGSAAVLLLGKKNILYTSDCWDIELPDDLPKIDTLILDSTGAEKSEPRRDIEGEIRQNILALAKETLERDGDADVYVTMFSTQLERAMWLENETVKMTGMYPCINGSSLMNNLDCIRPEVRWSRWSRVALTTGIWAQGQKHWDGESASALVRMANGTDRRCQLKKGDLVILSGSIPTWSPTITAQIKEMCEKIYALGVRLVVDTSAPEEWSMFAERREVHAGGHGNFPEITGLINKIRPRQVLPFHASPRAREKVAEYCQSKGIGVISTRHSSLITL